MQMAGAGVLGHNAQMRYRDAAINYLRMVMDTTGKSATELARIAGVSQTTFTRPLNDPDYKYAPKFQNLQILAGKLGLSLSDDLLSYVNLETPTATLKVLPVRGIVAAGLWQTVDNLADQALEYVPMVEDPRYSGFPQWADLIRGPSMNRHYLDGDYVHVVDAIALGYSPIPDDHVIVDRREQQGGKIERTCKKVVLHEGRLALAGDSTEEKWNKPLPLSDEEDVEVEVVGLVIGSYRSRRR